MTELAKIFVVTGCVFIVAGLLLFLLPRVPALGRLPGDVVIKKENVTFYFPIVTSILLSLVLSLILFLFRRG